MKFTTFWQTLAKQLAVQKDFTTLKRHTKFTALFSKNFVIVTPQNTQYVRQVSYKDFEKVWNKAAKLPSYEQFNSSNYHDETFHIAYILTLIKLVIDTEKIE